MVRWNKRFPPSATLGHGVYHSIGKQTQTPSLTMRGFKVCFWYLWILLQPHKTFYSYIIDKAHSLFVDEGMWFSWHTVGFLCFRLPVFPSSYFWVCYLQLLLKSACTRSKLEKKAYLTSCHSFSLSLDSPIICSWPISLSSGSLSFPCQYKQHM